MTFWHISLGIVEIDIMAVVKTWCITKPLSLFKFYCFETPSLGDWSHILISFESSNNKVQKTFWSNPFLDDSSRLISVKHSYLQIFISMILVMENLKNNLNSNQWIVILIGRILVKSERSHSSTLEREVGKKFVVTEGRKPVIYKVAWHYLRILWLFQ